MDKQILSVFFAMVFGLCILQSNAAPSNENPSNGNPSNNSIEIRVKVAVETVKLEVNSTDTIATVKAKLQEKVGYSPDQIHLIFASQVLEENRTLNDYEIQDQSFLWVVLRLRGEEHSFEKTSTGETKCSLCGVAGKEESSESNNTAKAGERKQIFISGGLPARTIYIDDEQPNANNSAQSNSNNTAQSNTNNTAEGRGRRQIFVKTGPPGRTIYIDDEQPGANNTTATNNSTETEDNAEAEEETIELVVRTITKSVKVNVKLSDTVETLRQKIFEATGMPVKVQRRLVSAGKLLENGHKLSDYDLKDGSVVSIVTCGHAHDD